MIRASFVFAAALLAAPATAQEAWHPSPYGPDDRRGAMNNLSPEATLRAVALVKLGKVYALGVPTGPGTPAYEGRSYKAEVLPPPGAPLAEPLGANQVTAYDERVTTSMGIGSQIDGLGHLGIGHRYYNGLTAAQVNTPEGFALDLADLPPVATRGVLIDMTRHFGKPMLEPGQVFNRAEIEAAAKAQGVTIGKGDVVLFHTGWLSRAATDGAAFIAGQPGLGEDGARYLADLGVVAVGADTAALEVIPFEDPARPFVVHQTLLAKRGVHILETMDTAALAADRASEFLFVLGAPRFEGTVQVVINPVAIR